MKFTKQQRTLAAALALGVGALAFDRLFLDDTAPGPSQAAADPVVPASAARHAHRPEAAERPADPSADPLDDAGLIPARLIAAAGINGVAPEKTRDAFAPTAAAQAAAAAAAQKKATATAETPAADVAAAQFVSKHKLTGVMNAPTGGIAVIDGHAVRVGESCDTFELVSVGTRTALLKLDGVSVELQLPGPGAKGR